MFGNGGLEKRSESYNIIFDEDENKADVILDKSLESERYRDVLNEATELVEEGYDVSIDPLGGPLSANIWEKKRSEMVEELVGSEGKAYKNKKKANDWKGAREEVLVNGLGAGAGLATGIGTVQILEGPYGSLSTPEEITAYLATAASTLWGAYIGMEASDKIVDHHESEASQARRKAENLKQIQIGRE